VNRIPTMILLVVVTLGTGERPGDVLPALENGQSTSPGAHRLSCTATERYYMNEPKAYLAGFDVFRVDAIAHGEHLKSLCAAAGLMGLFPLDNDLPHELAGPEAAAWICQQNMAMLCEADLVIANLGNFRGAEPDSGTVFEVGVAVAMGKPVWVYFPERGSLRQQVPSSEGRCRDGYFVEDFGLPKNLMLACQWAGAEPTVDQAIERAAETFLASKQILSSSLRMG
jgi:nucleoside 2-deoxyribosyltransferase